MGSHAGNRTTGRRRVAAFDLACENSLTGALVDDSGAVIDRAQHTLGGETGEAAVQILLDFVDTLIARADEPVHAIGVGTPGIIDDAGKVRYATALHWRDLPLAERIHRRFGLPTAVGNDIDATALAAVRFRDIAVRDLLLISLDNSIGMGIMVGGRLVAGEHFNAGEIAHVTVIDDGLTCMCGRRGCILAYIGAARAAVASRFVSDHAKSDALLAAGRALGIMIAPIASALNLTTVIISGPSDLVTGDVIAAASDACEARTLPLLNTSIDITAMRDDADLVLLGAAARALERCGDGT